MKKIGFIGAYDKTDLLLNLAKILTAMGENVLIVDSTLNQKARYIVPAIDPTVSYITSFEDIDVAVGFDSLERIKDYTGTSKDLTYDIVLIDIDQAEKVANFKLEESFKNYFVTSFDVYSLKKGLETVGGLKTPINLTKILYSKDMLKEEDDYLNFLSLGCKLVWDDMRIYFPLENGDLNVIAENQRVQKIKLKKLSVQYKDSLIFIAQQILGEKTDSNIRRVEKALEKGA